MEYNPFAEILRATDNHIEDSINTERTIRNSCNNLDNLDNDRDVCISLANTLNSSGRKTNNGKSNSYYSNSANSANSSINANSSIINCLTTPSKFSSPNYRSSSVRKRSEKENSSHHTPSNNNTNRAAHSGTSASIRKATNSKNAATNQKVSNNNIKKSEIDNEVHLLLSKLEGLIGKFDDSAIIDKLNKITSSKNQHTAKKPITVNNCTKDVISSADTFREVITDSHEKDRNIKHQYQKSNSLHFSSSMSSTRYSLGVNRFSAQAGAMDPLRFTSSIGFNRKLSCLAETLPMNSLQDLNCTASTENLLFTQFCTVSVNKEILSGNRPLDRSSYQPVQLCDTFPLPATAAASFCPQFSFPFGAKMSLVRRKQAKYLLDSSYDKMHIMQFTDENASVLYACFLIVNDIVDDPSDSRLRERMTELSTLVSAANIIKSYIRFYLYRRRKTFLEKSKELSNAKKSTEHSAPEVAKVNSLFSVFRSHWTAKRKDEMTPNETKLTSEVLTKSSEKSKKRNLMDRFRGKSTKRHKSSTSSSNSMASTLSDHSNTIKQYSSADSQDTQRRDSNNRYSDHNETEYFDTCSVYSDHSSFPIRKQMSVSSDSILRSDSGDHTDSGKFQKNNERNKASDKYYGEQDLVVNKYTFEAMENYDFYTDMVVLTQKAYCIVSQKPLHVVFFKVRSSLFCDTHFIRYHI